MLTAYLEQITFWHWLIFGVLLVILEVFAPGVVFLWLGIAAFITGTVHLVVPVLPWENQFLIFAALAIVCILSGRYFVARRPSETDHPNLNERGQQHVGRTFVLVESITTGVGKISVDDSTWLVSGADMPKGTQVKVTGVEGSTLTVDKA